MRYLKNDVEERILSSREELREYLDFRKENDVWVFPTCNECSCVGLNPLAEKVPEDIPEAIANEALLDNKLLFVFPLNFRFETYPIRYTAFPDVCARAGLAGRTIYNTEDKGKISALDVVTKGQWLSTGLSLNGNECKILLRDEKVASVKSHEYQIFPEHKIVSILEEEMLSIWPDYRYVTGNVSHEYLKAEYVLNAYSMEESFKYKLEELGVINIDSLRAGIEFTTSDVGNSCVNISPFYILNGEKLRLGKPITIRHDVTNTFDTIKTAVSEMATTFREAEDRIEELGNIDIKFPKDCFMNIVSEYKLPKTVAAKIADEFDTDVTAIDIFIALNELVEQHYAASKMSLTSFITLSENVAKLMYIDFAAFDKSN